MEFQKRLYELRRRAGLSQEGLAELLGVTRQAVQKWEAGTSRPDLDNLAALARYFGVTIDELVTGRATEPPQSQPIVVNHYHRGLSYTYRSRRTLFGLPLVHIRLGSGRGPGVARGIFAVGNVAVGVVALGGISLGGISLGGLSFGLLALGGLAVGGVALGGGAVGLLAFGGAAVGLLAVGGSAVGSYAVGGSAAGSRVAIGAAASAPLAIGSQSATGALTFGPGADPEAVAAAIRQSMAGAPGWLSDLMTWFGTRIL